MNTITIEEDFLSDRVTLARDGVEIGYVEPDIVAAQDECWKVHAPSGTIVAAYPSKEFALSHLRLMATEGKCSSK